MSHLSTKLQSSSASSLFCLTGTYVLTSPVGITAGSASFFLFFFAFFKGDAYLKVSVFAFFVGSSLKVFYSAGFVGDYLASGKTIEALSEVLLFSLVDF